jgi:hypothetical protein
MALRRFPLTHSLHHPSLGGLERAPAQRMNGDLVVDPEKSVAAKKKVPPSPEPGMLLERKIGIFEAGRIQLVKMHRRRKRTRGLVVVEDGERRDNRAAPRRHLVKIEEKPVWEEKDLRRNRGQILPGKLPKKRQI